MPGFADIALGAAPIAGGVARCRRGKPQGALISGNDQRRILNCWNRFRRKTDLRAALEQSIYERIADLIATTDKSRQLREIAASYRGNWRDIVVFVCAVLFTIVWWNVPTAGRTGW